MKKRGEVLVVVGSNHIAVDALAWQRSCLECRGSSSQVLGFEQLDVGSLDTALAYSGFGKVVPWHLFQYLVHL